jgi:hypothetical protein
MLGELVEHRVHATLAASRVRGVTDLACLPQLAQSVANEILQTRRRSRRQLVCGAHPTLPSYDTYEHDVDTGPAERPRSSPGRTGEFGDASINSANDLQ